MRPLTEYHRSITAPVLLEARDALDRLRLPKDAYQAFHSQFSSAKHRNIQFLFTLEEWWAWWQTYDHEHGCTRWDRRGMGKTALVMARFGDVGPYSPANVYCATHSQNTKDCCDRDPSRLSLQAIQWHAQNDCHLKGKRGDSHPKSHPVITPDGRFGSAALAGEHYGITRQAVKYRADRRINGWCWEPR
jgi:hypothetical protein